MNPIRPCAAGVSIDAVRELIRNICNVDVSRRTSWKALVSLGFNYCKLTRKVKLISKRRKRIETFIKDYEDALENERKGEAILVYMDESYVHSGHKSTHGWDVKSDMAEHINNCDVQQEEGVVRGGEVAGGKGTRHVFLCALSKDGIVRDTSTTYNIRAETYESKMDVQYNCSSWIFQARKKGLKDYHDNMDSPMFITWVKNRLMPSFTKMYWTETHKPTMILVLDNAPYHHKAKEGCVDLFSCTNLRPTPISASTAEAGIVIVNAPVQRSAKEEGHGNIKRKRKERGCGPKR